MDALRALVPTQSLLWVTYDRHNPPTRISKKPATNVSAAALDNFLTNTYSINPTFVTFQSGLDNGVYRLTDLAPDNFDKSVLLKELRIRHLSQEEVGYLTQGWPKDMTETVIVTNLPNNRLSEITLFRSRRLGGFSQQEIETLGSLEPCMSAVISQHFEKSDLKPTRTQSSNLQRTSVIDAGILTQREKEVADLVLKGHSSLSVAHILQISVLTVKSHRKNMYRKLNISSQTELFALFSGLAVGNRDSESDDDNRVPRSN